MATNAKMKPCPDCKSDEHLAVYEYDHGGKRVECTSCNYLGPCSGSIRFAIKLHNERVENAASQK